MSERRFSVVYASASAGAVARYVSRGFFSLREFPQAFARMMLTGEFGRFVGIPLLLLIVARSTAEAYSQFLTLIAVVWLVAGLFRISRYGRSSGIGCYVATSEGAQPELAGGLRMRLEKRSRRIWIAGLLVEPHWRGAGIGTALILAAFRLAQAEARNSPVTVSVFAPSHPASKAIIERQLGGMQTIAVTEPPSAELSAMIERLEQALQHAHSSFDWQLQAPDGGLFNI